MDKNNYTIHELKIAPQFFHQVTRGNKPFEIRKDDRGFQKGDHVILKEFNEAAGYLDSHKYTGQSVSAEIGFVTSFEQQKGYVVFSLLNIGKVRNEHL